MAEKMAEQIAEILKEPNFQTAQSIRIKGNRT